MSYSDGYGGYGCALSFSDVEPTLNMDFPINNKMSSPWTYSRSSLSSGSPPGTGSSNSSTNSQCYSTSPDELCMDSFMNSLLHVYNRDFCRNNSPSYSQSIKSNCNSSKCGDCDFCRQSIHSNLNFAIDQRHANNSPLHCLPLDIPSPPLITPSSSPSHRSPFYCDIHMDALKFYCQTCSVPVCSDCGIHRHHGHVTVHLMEAMNDAAIQADRVMKEANVGISTLKEDLETVQLAAETLEQKARQANQDVRTNIRRIASALEAKEKELLGSIEKARQMKLASLRAKDESLRNGIVRLSRAVDKLAESIESSAMTNNPLDLLISKDVASADVIQIRRTRQMLPNHEENWISFTGSENDVLVSIANLGSIVVNNPGPIGDRRPLRGRGTSPPMFPTHSLLNTLIAVPRGRAIPSSDYPVIVKTIRYLHSDLKSIKIIGNDGEAEDNLCRPWGIACNKEGQFIVADRSNNRIQIYRQDGSFLRRFGSLGKAPGQFDRPAGVAVDRRRRIVVADKDNHRIQILTMEGVPLKAFGSKGSRCGQFNYPWDVAVNSECQIVVSDTRNHRIQLFSPEGAFLRRYGHESAPNMWKHFDTPRGVAFNPDGGIVMTDFNNHRVLVVDPDFMNVRVFGTDINNGGTSKQFLRPQGLIVDDEGNVIVADSKHHRIQIFDSAGNLKSQIGQYGQGPNDMDRPSGIALTPDGKIAVVDFGNNRVLVI